MHAVSSRNMYSEHGFEARIGPDLGQVCQSLMVVSYWEVDKTVALIPSGMFKPATIYHSTQKDWWLTHPDAQQVRKAVLDRWKDADPFESKRTAKERR